MKKTEGPAVAEGPSIFRNHQIQIVGVRTMLGYFFFFFLLAFFFFVAFFLVAFFFVFFLAAFLFFAIGRSPPFGNTYTLRIQIIFSEYLISTLIIHIYRQKSQKSLFFLFLRCCFVIVFKLFLCGVWVAKS